MKGLIRMNHALDAHTRVHGNRRESLVNSEWFSCCLSNGIISKSCAVLGGSSMAGVNGSGEFDEFEPEVQGALTKLREGCRKRWGALLGSLSLGEDEFRRYETRLQEIVGEIPKRGMERLRKICAGAGSLDEKQVKAQRYKGLLEQKLEEVQTADTEELLALEEGESAMADVVVERLEKFVSEILEDMNSGTDKEYWKQGIALVICLLVSAGISMVALWVGRQFRTVLFVQMGFLCVIQVIAVILMLGVSFFTYYVLFAHVLASPVLPFALGGCTVFSALFSIIFIAVPYLQTAFLVVLLGSLCLFEWNMLRSKDEAMKLIKPRITAWLYGSSLPTFLGLSALYACVVVMICVHPEAAGKTSVTYVRTQAFTAGAAAFQIILCAFSFLFHNWVSFCGK